MRIATSMIYAQQTAAIDDQQSLYAQIGQQLAPASSSTIPATIPARIGQDLELTLARRRRRSGHQRQSAVSELTTTDSALSS